MMQIHTIVRYLKECYQADNREAGLLDFYSQKVEHRFLLAEAAILTEAMPIYPVDPDWGEEVDKTLAVYLKEKELMLAYLFLTGEHTLGNKRRRVVTPLFLIPTDLEKRDEDYFARPQIENAIVNPSAIALLNAGVESAPDIVSALHEWITGGQYLYGDLGVLRKMLIDAFPDLQAAELLMYPSLFDQKTIQQAKKKNGNHLLPAAGLGVLRKSSVTVGILSELETLCQTEEYSSALKAFFGDHGTALPAYYGEPLVPAVLSKAQTQIFRAVAQNKLTQVTGPPGTGKSFVIAALAIDLMSRGESVLIVSANDQAVDVIHNKIASEFQLEQVTVRGGGKRDYKSVLKKRLENWLSGIGVEVANKKIIKLLEREVSNIQDKLASLERQYIGTSERTCRDGIFLANYQNTWFQHLRKLLIRWQTEHRVSLDKLLTNYQEKLLLKHQKVKWLLQHTFNHQLYWTLRQHRRELQRLLGAIRARTSSKQMRLFSQIDFNVISRTLPVWLVNITEISHILPMKKEMFDVVIVDEATQCDIASILPVLQRSKKVVVAGDPKQLRHVSFLSRKRQQQIAAKIGLSTDVAEQYNYRDDSLLDIVNRNLLSQTALVFLDEHYRSQPSIIQFSNEHFYQSQLRIMTAQPQNEQVQHVHVMRILGKRHEVGHNQQEAEVILRKVREILNAEAHLPTTACQTLGIVSPFRQQVDYLRNQVAQELDAAALQRHQLLIGTPYTFQGEERDVMFISLAVDKETHPSTFQHLSREDVFNVSVTRARSEQWIITSLHKPTGYAAAVLLEKYLAYCEQYESEFIHKEKTVVHDTFSEAVIHWLREKGYQEIYSAYTIAGIDVDIVVVHNGQTYCIDLVGHPGAMDQAFPIERCNILQRIGLQSLPISYTQWFFNKEEALQSLYYFLSRNEVK
uniref:AAA domain-containing protein n=1 Tax=Roseihalotalea indica TaxID=2867963 RepID=A0AA49GPC7_9BACT|nr:AAA domain-containing protein [Tunicatimonas sp. TK19036]